MVIVLDIYGHDVAMRAIEYNGDLVMLSPHDGKVQDYVMKNASVKYIKDNVEIISEAYVNDNVDEIDKVFKLFDAAEQNYFEVMSSELVMIVCKL